MWKEAFLFIIDNTDVRISKDFLNIHGTITVVKNREDGNDVEETNILVVDDEKKSRICWKFI